MGHIFFFLILRVLYSRYFTLFMNLLNEFADASQQLEKDSSWQEAEASKLNSLRSSIIQAISNLLSANIDSGLMHSIGKLRIEIIDTYIFGLD